MLEAGEHERISGRAQTACSEPPAAVATRARVGAGGAQSSSSSGVRNICSFCRDKLTPNRANGGCNGPFSARNEP